MGPATPSRLTLNEASWSGTACSAGYEWISEPAARGYDRLTPACPNNHERQKRLLHHLIRVELRSRNSSGTGQLRPALVLDIPRRERQSPLRREGLDLPSRPVCVLLSNPYNGRAALRG